MLDPWIIEEIRKREENDERDERPMLEIPLGPPEEEEAEDRAIQERDQEGERGVVVVDFRV